MSAPIPDALAKRGIQRVTDNLGGREVVLPAGTIVMFFGKELARALEARSRAQAVAKPRDVNPEPGSGDSPALTTKGTGE